MRTSDSSAHTVRSAKPPTPSCVYSWSPSRRTGRRPRISVPAAFARLPGSHSAGRPPAHATQCPHIGTNEKTTLSPGATRLTPGPIASTVPAASCPIASGTGRTNVPSTVERSEWHTPTLATATWTSP
jgi:hypothetical protein